MARSGSSAAKINDLTIVYSLAGIDKETYLLLQCTVNSTPRKPKKSWKDIFKSPLTIKCKSSIEETPDSSPKMSRLIISGGVGGNKQVQEKPNPQTHVGEVEQGTKDEDKESDSEERVWKPISTMHVPCEYTRSENVCISGDTDPTRLEESSKQHFHNQTLIRQASQSAGSSTVASASQGTSEARGTPDKIFCDDIMSLVYLDHYVYVIGIVIGGEATELVRRIEVVREDGEEPACIWEEVPSLPAPCPYHASCVTNDSIVVMGGVLAPNCLKKLCFSNDRLNMEWQEDEQYGAGLVPRQKHRLLYQPDEYYCVLGGINIEGGEDELSRSGEYTLMRSFGGIQLHYGWEPLPSMNHGRTSFIAFCHRRYMYAIGGCMDAKENVISIERRKLSSRRWELLKGFETDTLCLLGFVIQNNICILGGKPKTFQIKSSGKIQSVSWDLSPTIDLPVIYFENAISTVVQLVQTI